MSQPCSAQVDELEVLKEAFEVWCSTETISEEEREYDRMLLAKLEGHPVDFKRMRELQLMLVGIKQGEQRDAELKRAEHSGVGREDHAAESVSRTSR